MLTTSDFVKVKVKYLYLYWISLLATWADLPRVPVRATPRGSNVCTGRYRSLGSEGRNAFQFTHYTLISVMSLDLPLNFSLPQRLYVNKRQCGHSCCSNWDWGAGKTWFPLRPRETVTGYAYMQFPNRKRSTTVLTPYPVNLILSSLALIMEINDRWTFVKLYPQKNDFWAPDGDQTRNLLMTVETLQPLSYPIVRWWTKVDVRTWKINFKNSCERSWSRISRQVTPVQQQVTPVQTTNLNSSCQCQWKMTNAISTKSRTSW